MAPKRSLSIVIPESAVKRAKTATKKRSRKTRPYQTVVRGPDPFGSKFITTLTYADSHGISPVGIPVQQYRMNSIYDPDFTGVGHQPMGRDQLAALYEKYRVIGFEYEVTAWGDPSTAQPANLIICPTNGNKSFASGLSMMEQPNAVWKTILINGQAENKITGYIDLAKFLGDTPTQYRTDDTTASLMNTNPFEVMLLNITVCGATGNFGQGSILCRFKYHVELFDPIPLDPS